MLWWAKKRIIYVAAPRFIYTSGFPHSPFSSRDGVSPPVQINVKRLFRSLHNHCKYIGQHNVKSRVCIYIFVLFFFFFAYHKIEERPICVTLTTGKHEIFAAVKLCIFFFYFEHFAGGNFTGFFTHGKVGLLEGNKFAG